MSLTKIVVVVGEHKEIFEGKVEATGYVNGPVNLLYIMDNTNPEKPKELASFNEWTYWRYTD